MQPFFIVVEGQRGPRVPHETRKEAQEEAGRLYEQYQGTRRIFLLETVEVVDPLPQ